MPRSRRSSLPPQVEIILKKLDKLLQSDEEQNKTIAEPYRAQIVGGLVCDVIPGAQGEFGRSPSNPIPTNGPLGEVTYLSRLRTNVGSPVMFHRLRSEEAQSGPVDVYEVLSLDFVAQENLFLSMYHPRKSRKVPLGYTYAAELDPSNFIYGVNHLVEEFPAKLDAHIRNWHKEALGIPLPVALVREAIHGTRFGVSFLDDVESEDRDSVRGRLRDDILKLVRAREDPRFHGRAVGIGIDGVVRPIDSDVEIVERRLGNTGKPEETSEEVLQGAKTRSHRNWLRKFGLWSTSRRDPK